MGLDSRPERTLWKWVTGVCQTGDVSVPYHVYPVGLPWPQAGSRWLFAFHFFGSGGPIVAEINEIEQKVIDIVAEQMGVDKAEITRDTSFINDLNADSLDTVELVMEFEDEFEMSIPDEEAEKIQTVGQAIDYIKSVSDKQGPKE